MFKELLEKLLNDLDRIARDHKELHDSEVRVALRKALNRFFISPDGTAAQRPEDFRMHSSEANNIVGTALFEFIDSALTLCEDLSPRDRLTMFQNEDVCSANRSYYDDYFGYDEIP